MSHDVDSHSNSENDDNNSNSSDEWENWEVIDVHTTSSKDNNSNKKSLKELKKEAKKKKEVENLASIITERLAVNQNEEKRKMQELNDKIQAQQLASEQQLEIIRMQLEQISRLQAKNSQESAANKLLATKEKNEQAKLIEQACSHAAALAAKQAAVEAARAAKVASSEALENASKAANIAAARAANEAAQQAAISAAKMAANEAAIQAANLATQQASAQVSEAAMKAAEQAANKAAQRATYEASEKNNAFLTNFLATFAIGNGNSKNNDNNSVSNVSNNNNNVSDNKNQNAKNYNYENMGTLSNAEIQFLNEKNEQNEEKYDNYNNNNNNNNSNNKNGNIEPGRGGGGLLSALTTMFVGGNGIEDDIDINGNNEAKSSTLLDDDCFWDCVSCGATNDESYQFCPKCGARNDLVFNTNMNDLNKVNQTAKGILKNKKQSNDENYNNNKSKNNELNVNLLKYTGSVGQDKKFAPGETRQCGWVFENESTYDIIMCVSVVNVNESDQLVGCDFEKTYQFCLGPKEEFYLLFNVKAPIVPGKYSNLYQLVTDDSKIIPHTLELLIDVKTEFTQTKEKKIADIVKMGFEDRAQIIAALQSKKWNVQNAVDSLLQG